MKYEQGNRLELVIADDISWGKKGDVFTYIRNSKKYDTDNGLLVVDDDGNSHCVNEYRVALHGDEKAIAKCIANAPKLFVVLQDSCRNFNGERAIVGLEDAEKLAARVVSQGETQTVYELKAVKRVSKEPQIIDA